MGRPASLLRGEARPLKRICPPQTRSPHSDLSQPPLEVWCVERVHPHFSSVWQLGDASVFPPLQPILLSPAGHMLGDTVGSLLQRTDPVPAAFQSSTSLSINPNKDAESFPSRWRASLLPGLLDIPNSGMSSFARHSASSIAFHSRMGASTGVSLWVLRTVRSGYTFSLGEIPPRFDGVHLTVVNSASKASVLQQELSSLLQKGAIEEIPQSDIEQGFFSRYFLVPKKGRRPEAHSGSAASEFFPLQREVQDADDENHHVSDSRRGLVCHYRPKGCIFLHPGRSATQEVPSVCLWKEGLPIHGPVLRPGLGTKNVHEMHECCTGPFEVPGHSCAELSG